MDIQAHFNNISSHIIDEIENAKKSIYIAIAWFTNRKIFDILCEKAESGIEVEVILIDDKINQGSRGLNFNKLTEVKGSVHWIKEHQSGKGRMHNKFCIIDESIVLTGSFNWSRSAEKNYENITVIKDDPILVIQYMNEFKYIKSRLTGETIEYAKIDTGIILKRMDVLKKVISLEDVEDIRMQVNKLSNIIENYDDRSWKTLADIKRMIDLVEKTEYHEAINLIDEILHEHSQVMVYEDPEIPAIKLEIRGLEYQISSLQNEHAELEKLVHTFEVRHNQELGELTIKILKFKHKTLKDQVKEDESKREAYEEAKRDYEEYQQSFSELEKEEVLELSDFEIAEIKILYRKGSMHCHPDVIADEFKDEATAIFIELNNAYKKNDLNRVRQIVNDLENNVAFISQSETDDKKKELILKINELKKIRGSIIDNIQSVKDSQIYNTIMSIDDWDEYFEDMKNKLSSELNLLVEEIETQ